MRISFVEPKIPTSGAVVAGVSEGRKLSPAATELDKASGGGVRRALRESTFEGKAEQMLEIVAPAKLKVGRILLVGLGKGLDTLEQERSRFPSALELIKKSTISAFA